MAVRRVVTGNDSRGNSTFVSDEVLEPLRAAALPGTDTYYLWGADKLTVPTDGSEPDWTTHFPPATGFRFDVFGMMPSSVAGQERPPTSAEIDEAAQQFPGLMDTFDPEDIGMHASDTVDVAIMLSGCVVIELDGGEQRELNPGDVLVQNGTRHKWSNPGDEMAMFAIVLVGANRTS